MQINHRSIKFISKSLSASSCLSDCYLSKNILSICHSGFMYCLAFSWLCIFCLLPCLHFPFYLYSDNTVLVNQGTPPKATSKDISPASSLRGHLSPFFLFYRNCWLSGNFLTLNHFCKLSLFSSATSEGINNQVVVGMHLLFSVWIGLFEFLSSLFSLFLFPYFPVLPSWSRHFSHLIFRSTFFLLLPICKMFWLSTLHIWWRRSRKWCFA